MCCYVKWQNEEFSYDVWSKVASGPTSPWIAAQGFFNPLKSWIHVALGEEKTKSKKDSTLVASRNGVARLDPQPLDFRAKLPGVFQTHHLANGAPEATSWTAAHLKIWPRYRQPETQNKHIHLEMTFKSHSTIISR